MKKTLRHTRWSTSISPASIIRTSTNSPINLRKLLSIKLRELNRIRIGLVGWLAQVRPRRDVGLSPIDLNVVFCNGQNAVPGSTERARLGVDLRDGLRGTVGDTDVDTAADALNVETQLRTNGDFGADFEALLDSNGAAYISGK